MTVAEDAHMGGQLFAARRSVELATSPARWGIVEEATGRVGGNTVGADEVSGEGNGGGNRVAGIGGEAGVPAEADNMPWTFEPSFFFGPVYQSNL